MHRAILTVACVALLACQREQGAGEWSASPAATATPAPGCGRQVVTGNGIGALRIGAPVDSVRVACAAPCCAVLRDTTERRAEGHPVRVIAVALGSDTVEAEVDGGRVWRVEVTRPSPRTADSLGVGTTLARLLALPDARGLSGEGAVFVVSPAQCGLSFQLSEAGSGAPPEQWDAAALRRLPPSTVVSRVLIVGCRAAP